MIEQFLNNTVWATLAPSKTHGIGVFAIRDIPKGQKLYCYPFARTTLELKTLDGILPEIRDIIIQRHPLATKGGEFMSPNDDSVLIVFMNHADTPNYDKETDTTLIDIKKGDEIFEDYGECKEICLP